jgi:rhodanese-related sulfurtransferase
MRPHVTISAPASPALNFRLNHFAVMLQTLLAVLLLGAVTAAAQPATLSVSEAYEAATKGDIILVDIRTPEEWAETGIAEGAIALDMRTKSFVNSLLALRESYPDKQIAFICAVGGRSGYLNRFLFQNGFGNTADIPEGMLGSRAGPGWLKAGLPVYPGEAGEISRRLELILISR